MQSAWIDRDADAAVARYEKLGRDVGLRVYTTRLLGGDPRLVLHGGGNTSVKTRIRDLNGEDVEVLCVKGSGWDMGTIEPAGLPAVRLAPLLKLRARETLSDEDMVRLQRANLIDPSSPNPSVEALLHAFIPHKFIDHTHSTAVLSLTDQPDGEALCREVFGARVGYVPYLMPGFGLAKAAAQMFDADPSVEGLVLVKHGIFSFGSDARQAYERMIALVTLAEQRLVKNRKAAFVSAKLPAHAAAVAEVAPILRGACSLPDGKSDGAWKRFVQTTGCCLVSVDYRLAPEHKFPAAIEDAIAATRWVSGEAATLRIDPTELVVGGDSAGATLAAVVCQDALRNGPVIAAQCLICPVLDFEETSPSREAFAENHLLDRVTLEADLADYLHDNADLADPRISPLRATRFAGLPPAIIHTAEFDPVRDEGNAYAGKLVAAGVDVEHVCHDGMIHNFHAMGAILPQGRLVLRQIGEQVRRALGD